MARTYRRDKYGKKDRKNQKTISSWNKQQKETLHKYLKNTSKKEKEQGLIEYYVDYIDVYDDYIENWEFPKENIEEYSKDFLKEASKTRIQYNKIIF